MKRENATETALILFDGQLLEFTMEQVQAARERGQARLRTGQGVDIGKDALPEPLLTAEELSARLNVPSSHCYAMARSGKWPCVKVGGRYVRFRASEVLSLLHRGARSK